MPLSQSVVAAAFGEGIEEGLMAVGHVVSFVPMCAATIEASALTTHDLSIVNVFSGSIEIARSVT
jgi:hypothetical protein